MKKMAPTVSTIIPAYNCEKTLGQALDSILAQTHLPDEIIVINDGSTDGTANIVESYAKKHPICCITQENSGPAIARNHGVKVAQSEWITFLDSDDYWYPWHLDNLMAVIELHPDLSWAAAVYDKEKVIQKQKPFSQSSILPNYLTIARQKIDPVHTNTTLIHRTAFWECGGFREDWRNEEDVWLWYQIGLRYPRIGYSPIASSFRTDRPNSLSKQNASYPEALAMTIRNTDEMIQVARTEKLLEREDVQIFLGNRISKILYLSLLTSNHEHEMLRKKYHFLLSHVTLPIRMRLYACLSFLKLPVPRLHKTAIFFHRCLRKLLKTGHCQKT